MKKILLYIILFLSGIDGAWALPIEKEGMSIYSPSLKQEDFYKNSEQRLQQQAVKISQLETTLEQYRTYDAMSRTLVPELKVLYPSITTLSIAHSLEVRVDSMKTDTVTLAVLKFDRHPSAAEKQKISEWLKARVGAKKLRLITE